MNRKEIHARRHAMTGAGSGIALTTGPRQPKRARIRIYSTFRDQTLLFAIQTSGKFATIHFNAPVMQMQHDDPDVF